MLCYFPLSSKRQNPHFVYLRVFPTVERRCFWIPGHFWAKAFLTFNRSSPSFLETNVLFPKFENFECKDINFFHQAAYKSAYKPAYKILGAKTFTSRGDPNFQNIRFSWNRNADRNVQFITVWTDLLFLLFSRRALIGSFWKFRSYFTFRSAFRSYLTKLISEPSISHYILQTLCVFVLLRTNLTQHHVWTW